MNDIMATAPWTWLGDMLAQPFVRHALVAGGLVAAACGCIGALLVLRAQVFGADALGHAAFTGAMLALVAGVDLRFGLFGTCAAVGLALAALDRHGRADDVVIGSVFAWLLGVGALLLSIYTTRSSGIGNASTGVNVLFGTVFGLDGASATLSGGIAIGVIVVLAAAARPLVFASIDPAVAAAAGVPVGPLGALLLLLTGIVAGEATQTMGALLLLGLVAAPGGAARRLTTSPHLAIWLGGLIALACMWAGIVVAYTWSAVPPSTAVLLFAASAYAGTGVWSRPRRYRSAPRSRSDTYRVRPVQAGLPGLPDRSAQPLPGPRHPAP